MDRIFEFASLLMRFFFIALMALIVLRGFKMTLTDGRKLNALRNKSQEAHAIGELVALKDAHRVNVNDRFPLCSEGVLGSGRYCDTRIKSRSIKQQHLSYELRDSGMLIKCIGTSVLRLENGQPVKKLLLNDFDVFFIGKLPVRIVLYTVDDPADAPEEQNINETEEPDELFDTDL